jgi:hypothetical protein
MLPDNDFPKSMTLQKAKSIARHLKLTLRQVRSGEYRVNFRDGNETIAGLAEARPSLQTIIMRIAAVQSKTPGCARLATKPEPPQGEQRPRDAA